MDYVEWVDRVARSYAALRPGATKIIGLAELRAAMALGPEADDAIWTAIEDLDRGGILEIDSVQWIKETDSTRRLRAGARLENLWPEYFARFLEEDELAFLGALVEVAQSRGETFADVEWVEHAIVFAKLGWTDADHDASELAIALKNTGVALRYGTLSPTEKLLPTYAGVVRATRRIATEWQERAAELVEEWETTTVEFKRELALGTEKQNAEFGHDVIALANTKSSGSVRYLVAGFHPDMHEFTAPLDPAITQDRLEQILDAYTKPAPHIRLVVFPDVSGMGDAGVIEVHRDTALLPHRMSKGGGKIKADDVFVRHGAHIVKPDPDELADLEAEGTAARA